MRRDYIEFQDRSEPLAYLITFRCFGTWLHGDKRGSVDRRHFNKFDGPWIAPNSEKAEAKKRLMKSAAYRLNPNARRIVEEVLREVCRHLRATLYSINVRTNHVHVVAGNAGKPERMMTTFKAYATRRLRREGLLGADAKAWSRHGSTKYLWSEEDIAEAVRYVELEQ